jgi:hypothetical protein
MFAAIGVFAQPAVISAPSADTPMYSVIVVDYRKLRVPLATALAQIPGNECLPAADQNVALNCPGVSINGGYSYYSNIGFPSFTVPDPRKPGRTTNLKIDGINFKTFSNFRVPAPCTIVGGTTYCPPAPWPQAMNVTVGRPTTEFGFRYRANIEGQIDPYMLGFFVTANGVDLGFFPSAPDGLQYIGVSAPEGLTNVIFRPLYVNEDFGGIGPVVGDKLYYK